MMEAITIEDLLRFRFVSGVKAAPCGERAAFVVRMPDEKNNTYTSNLYLYENGSVRQLTADGKSASPIWEDDTHILFPAVRKKEDQARAENGERFTSWYRLDIHGGEAQKAFEIPVPAGSLKQLDADKWFFTAQYDASNPDEYLLTGESLQMLLQERKAQEDYHILTDSRYRLNGAGFHEGMVSGLFCYDMSSGKTVRVTEPEMDVVFCTKRDQKIVYGVSERKKTENLYTQVYAFTPETGEMELLYGGNDFGIQDAFVLSDQLVLLATDYQLAGGNQNAAFYLLRDSKLEFLCDPDLAVGCSVGSDCRLGGGDYAQVYEEELYFTCTVDSRCELRKLTLDGEIIPVNQAEGSLDSFSITSKGTIFGTGLFDQNLTELYRIGKGKKHSKLSDFNRTLFAEKYIACPKKLSVKSCGSRIDGWVLLPKDYDPQKKYPAVLDIHGGPKTVYGEVLYHEMQVWASRGYFVFFCNPTGSDGRGNAFMDIRGKYGTVDYQNIMDFTDEVLRRYPQIDVSRVAVTGGSYGGFMTNWIIGHTDRFACAASQRSISNWFSFYGASDIGILFSNDQNNADIFRGQQEVWEHSPLKYAANVKTPTLFIHSEEDYRCPIDQGLQMYAALLELGVDTRFVWFRGENHDLSRSGKPKHRIKRLQEITDWIEKYTKE